MEEKKMSNKKFLLSVLVIFVVVFALFMKFSLNVLNDDELEITEAQRMYISLYLSFGMGVGMSLILTGFVPAWKKIKEISIIDSIFTGIIAICSLIPFVGILIGYFIALPLKISLAYVMGGFISAIRIFKIVVEWIKSLKNKE